MSRYDKLNANIGELLTTYPPTKSGISFKFDLQGLSVYPPEEPIDISDEELLYWILSYNNSTAFIDKLTPDVRINAIKFAKKMYPTRYIGGTGIRSRSIEEVEDIIPGTTSAIQNETGKIAFYGNGFSAIPLLVAEKYKQGKVTEPPVIVDLFDYGLAYQDMEYFCHEMHSRALKLPTPIKQMRKKLTGLVHAIDEGTVIAVQHCFGRDTELPNELTNVSLGINCFGPPEITNDELLSTLKVGGKLYTNHFNEEKKENFTAGYSFINNHAAIFTRTA